MRDAEWGCQDEVRLNRDDLKAMFSEMLETRSMQLIVQSGLTFLIDPIPIPS
ncbi:MAG: hypothetical protein AB9903_25080 [Vulcanimicrobiota bacterium]